MKVFLVVGLLLFSQTMLISQKSVAQEWAQEFDDHSEPDRGSILMDDIVADIQSGKGILFHINENKDFPQKCGQLNTLDKVLIRLDANLKQAEGFFSRHEVGDEFNGDATTNTLMLLSLEAPNGQLSAMKKLSVQLRRNFRCENAVYRRFP